MWARLASLVLMLALAACAPMQVQQAGKPELGFQGPHLNGLYYVARDGARLGLTQWMPTGEVTAAVVAVHGMNDYANAFHLAAPIWAKAGIATYAYDQRGFGRSPGRGIWGGEDLMVDDLRTMVSLVRAAHPGVPVVVVGESMGGSVAIRAFASDQPPAADRLVLMAPGVWGWSNQPLPYRTSLWFAAEVTPAKVYTPPHWLTRRVSPTDNHAEMIEMGRDPLMLWGARSDTLYGLVSLMERAWASTGQIKVRVLYLYGAHDQIIPKTPAYQVASRLKPGDRSAYYERGWHLLTRDHEGAVVAKDIETFILAPDAPLPSAPPPIPAPEA